MAPSGKAYGCPSCGMKFGSEAELMNHNKVHTSSAKQSTGFSCAACGATFRDAEGLRAHNRESHRM